MIFLCDISIVGVTYITQWDIIGWCDVTGWCNIARVSNVSKAQEKMMFEVSKMPLFKLQGVRRTEHKYIQ